MSDRKMVPGLNHRWGSRGHAFFKMIDECGGWPLGYQYAGFEHTDARLAGFCNSPHNDGWWTVVASADDYYLWKLSPKALQKIVDVAISNARITAVNAQSLSIEVGRCLLRKDEQ